MERRADTQQADGHSATAADFDAAAKRKARSFWLWMVVTGLMWWWASIWWAALPLFLALFAAFNSVCATRFADQLRNGTYKQWNINNGAPDGDARNRPRRTDKGPPYGQADD